MSSNNRTEISIIEGFQLILNNKLKFAALFILLFMLMIVILGKLDLLPEDNSEPRFTLTEISVDTAVPVAEAAEPEYPARIIIDRVGTDVVVNNPSSTSIRVLDHELLSGVVRYPTSAKLGELGNVVIFGHSSFLPVVRNENFKAFNGIEKLLPGDVIRVQSEGTEYQYKVTDVYEADATNAAIPLTKDSKKLTLSTCNSFGDLDDRHVVEAEFVGSTQLSS